MLVKALAGAPGLTHPEPLAFLEPRPEFRRDLAHEVVHGSAMTIDRAVALRMHGWLWLEQPPRLRLASAGRFGLAQLCKDHRGGEQYGEVVHAAAFAWMGYGQCQKPWWPRIGTTGSKCSISETGQAQLLTFSRSLSDMPSNWSGHSS